MRIIDTIKSEKVTLSFEVFPPKTSDKFENTYAALRSCSRSRPLLRKNTMLSSSTRMMM